MKQVKITPNGNYLVVGGFEGEDGYRYLVLERSTRRVYVGEKIHNLEDHGNGVVTSFDSIELDGELTFQEYQNLLSRGNEILPLAKSPDGENTFSVYGITFEPPTNDGDIDIEKLESWRNLMKKYPSTKKSNLIH